MAEGRSRPPRAEDRPEPEEDEWVEEDKDEAREQWVEDVPPSGGGPAVWEEEEPPRPVPKTGPQGIQAYYSWIAGLIGLIIGLLSFRACH